SRATLDTSGEGVNVTFDSPAFTDRAGNTRAAAAATSPRFLHDALPISVAYTSASPAANGNGWRNVNVTATFTATDALSGMGATEADETATDMADRRGEVVSVTVDSPAFTDRAGNTRAAAAATGPGFKID